MMIKKNLLQLMILLILAGCGSNTSEKDTNTEIEIPKPNEKCFTSTSNKKLEIVTWNVEHFPKNSTTTKQVAEIILGMGVDVIAMQEIKSKASFDNLLDLLPGYEGFIMVRSDINLAYIYKTSEVSLNKNPYGILKNYSHELPRSPYVLPIHSKATGLDVFIINNHLKAMGGDKNKARRRAASRLLKEYIDQNHPNDNVVVLGDLNDEITDTGKDNVFKIFIDDSSQYKFADSSLALEKNSKYWSYPSRPSHIDHILITDELFDNLHSTYSYVLKSCYRNYPSNISDHYPVCVVLQ